MRHDKLVQSGPDDVHRDGITAADCAVPGEPFRKNSIQDIDNRQHFYPALGPEYLASGGGSR